MVTKAQLPSRITTLRQAGIEPILDYFVESKHHQHHTYQQVMEMVTTYPRSTYSMKVSGLTSVLDRKHLDDLCRAVRRSESTLLIDAENDSLDRLIEEVTDYAVTTYNREYPMVSKTYQMYRKDAYSRLKADTERYLQQGLHVGVKLVRGAYWEQDVKTGMLYEEIEDTHRSYDRGAEYLLTTLDTATDSLLFATHNRYSYLRIRDIIEARGIPPAQVKVAQLLGMADKLTTEALTDGFSSMKYVPYGPITQCIPYMLRRLRENRGMLRYI